MDEDKLNEMLGPVRRRPRRDDHRWWRRHRAPARAVPRAGGRAGHRRRAGPAYRLRPAVRRRVAARPGRRRLRHLRRRGRHLLADRGAGLRAGRTRTARSTRPAPSCWRSARSRRSTGSSEAFRTGAGVGWHEHDEDVFVGCEQFFRPGYLANLVPELDPGARRRRRPSSSAGAKVADVGCGLGASTILLAEQFPQAQLLGCDYHEESIELARKRAADAGVAERIDFEIATRPGLRRQRLRPGRDVRLPARHGRPGRRGPPHPAVARRRRHLADRRARRRRHGGRQPQPGRPGLLRLLDLPVRAQRAVAERRLLAGRAGGREGDRRGGRARPASPGSAGPRRRRSTSSSRRGPEPVTDDGDAPAGARGTVGPVRAREPDRSGYAVRDGVRLYYEVHGAGPTTVLLLPPWSIVHSRVWKLQVPYLARHARVVSVRRPRQRALGPAGRPRGVRRRRAGRRRGRGAGRGRGRRRRSCVGLSMGARVLLQLAADHPDRVRGAVFVGAVAACSRSGRPARSSTFERRARQLRGLGAVERALLAPRPGRLRRVLLRRGLPGAALDPAGRGRGRRGRCETDAETLVATASTPSDGVAVARREARGLRRAGALPGLVVHGDDDRIVPLATGVALARALGVPARAWWTGGGHCVQARHPVWFNHRLRRFVERGDAPMRAREPDLVGDVDRDGVRDPLRGVRLRPDDAAA